MATTLWQRRVLLLTMAVMSLSVPSCYHGSARSAESETAKPFLAGAVLIQNATVALVGQDTTVSEIAIAKVDRGWRIMEIASESSVAPGDTVDAAGLFIHAGSAFERMYPTGEGSPAILVARTGPSVGDPAVALIGVSGDELWRPVSAEENRPPEPKDAAVGCYVVELGPWDNPAYAETQQAQLVPARLQLHWQYAWHLGGREHMLVATDGAGHIPGPATIAYYWGRTPSDSVWIVFNTTTQRARFQLTAEGADLGGTVRRYGHNLPSPTATAQVRLRRREC
jgi:hypothetical protein